LLPLCQIFLLVSTIFPQYRIENWSTEQGLPYKTVRSVLQTRDGYIWAATSDGLARFDGVRFTVFNTANSSGLKMNRLDFLAETVDGSLWIASEEGGLFRLRGGVFSSVSIADGLPGEIIYSLHADPTANRLTILTQKGIAVWQDEKIVSVEPMPEAKNRYDRLLDNTGALCVKEGDIVRRRAGGGTIEYKLPEDLPETDLTRVFEDRAGAVWIGVFHHPSPGKAKLFVFNNNQISIFSDRDGLPNATVEPILEDRNGGIWIALGRFEDGGLVKFENGKFRRFTKEDGFGGLGVFDLTQDREGGIWAAISDNGLARITPRFITSLTRENGGLSSDNVYPLYEDPDGIIWSGAWRVGKERNGGVDQFENGGFKFFAGENDLTSLGPTALFKDREGVLWIGALSGLTRYKDGKFTKYTKENGFPHGSVSAITQTRDGTLWMASEEGLTKLRDNQFTEFTIADGLPHSDLRNLHEARDGTLWLATMGGLGSYKDGKFTKYGEIPPIQIRSIYEDADGTLWFGSYDAGIFRFKNGEFKAITVKDGLFQQGAFQILEDDFGQFWISSNRGIYRVSRAELNDFADGKIQMVTIVAYGVKDGMADAECNGGRSPAGFKSKKDGTLWFPTQKGVAVINPAAVKTNPLPPPVVIETIRIDNTEQSAIRNPQSAIEMLPGQENLEIDYTGLSFIKPEQIRFRYRLEGLDDAWTEAGNRRTAFFPHLAPGEYTFRVIAANSDNIWNEEGATLKILVKPPFYRTWFFLLVCALVASLLIYAIYRRRILTLERARRMQEEFSRRLINAHESERRRIAAELHDSIGQSLAMIKNRIVQSAENITDENTRQQLNLITAQTTQTIGEVREISYNLRPYLLENLGLTKAVKSLLNKIAETGQIKIQIKLDDVDDLFEPDAEMSIYRIIQENLTNILKHAAATEAQVLLKKSERNLTILISDDGNGFDPKAANNKVYDKGGFGLLGISERVKMLGGTQEIESEIGGGTNVLIKIPLPQKSSK